MRIFKNHPLISLINGYLVDSPQPSNIYLWNIGLLLGLVISYGQMSTWGATVITNLMCAIPLVGQELFELIWEGYSYYNIMPKDWIALFMPIHIPTFPPTEYKVHGYCYRFSTSSKSRKPDSVNKGSDDNSNKPKAKELYKSLERETEHSQDLLFTSQLQVDESKNLRHRILDLFRANRHLIPGNAAWVGEQNVADRNVASRGTHLNQGDTDTIVAMKKLAKEQGNLVIDKDKLQLLRPYVNNQDRATIDALSTETQSQEQHFSQLSDALYASLKARRTLRSEILATGATLTPDSVESYEMYLNGGVMDSSDVE